MADFQLKEAPALEGYERTFPGVSLGQVPGLGIVSLAVPLGGEEEAGQAIAAAYQIGMPAVGRSAMGADDTRVVRLAADQLLAVFPWATPDAEHRVRLRLNGAVYTTDQSDVWVTLRLAGPDARKTLERGCPLDLHPDVFGIDHAARTSLEHMGAIVIRADADSYLLLSATSSAASFAHALETSAKNVS